MRRHDMAQRALIGLVCATLVSSILLLLAVPAIHAWERRNGYPYGRMCDPNLFNLYTSTCHLRGRA